MYETVETIAQAAGKQLTVGADEFTPIFIYIIVTSDANDIYSCLDFIERCAPESKAYSGEGAYYLMQLTSAADLLKRLSKAAIPPSGPIAIDRPREERSCG